ncbi:hypothetical protein [Burkholderia pyrrocinia]|uniref:hypothetical protein n=1 Tax=Burkholderia pyrrocinia TaxID=60550 RepID=UPI001ABAE13E|nr:hypothetical protein [Burkholderia pyrrocinia]
MIKKLLLWLMLVVSAAANAQFSPGQILTASELNSSFANTLQIAGGTLTGPLTVPTLTVTGTFTATGKVGLGNLAAQAADTVVANVTASSASPTAVALPSCSTANSALQYTSGTGLSCGTSFGLTTGTLAQFATTTSTQLAGVISDETGSGALVFGTSPTISGPTVTGGSINNTPIGATTANTGRFTTLTATGAITPSSTAGITGTTTNDDANAGSWAEFPAPTNLSTVSATSNTPLNVASISLTAGDWDVSGVGQFNPAGATTSTLMLCGTSNTSATRGAFGSEQVLQVTFPAGLGQVIATPTTRFKLSTTTTIYVVCNAGFSGGTLTISGFIRARRAR